MRCEKGNGKKETKEKGYKGGMEDGYRKKEVGKKGLIQLPEKYS